MTSLVNRWSLPCVVGVHAGNRTGNLGEGSSNRLYARHAGVFGILDAKTSSNRTFVQRLLPAQEWQENKVILGDTNSLRQTYRESLAIR